MTEQKLYEQGWERFPWWWILLENLCMFVPWAIGFAVMWPLRVAGVPVASLGYALFILGTVRLDGRLCRPQRRAVRCRAAQRMCPLQETLHLPRQRGEGAGRLALSRTR